MQFKTQWFQGATLTSISPSYGLGRAGRERREMVALLQDFLRGVGLTEVPSGFSDGSSMVAWLSISKDSVRGHLCGEGELGLVDEDLFRDGLTALLTWVSMTRNWTKSRTMTPLNAIHYHCTHICTWNIQISRNCENICDDWVGSSS